MSSKQVYSALGLWLAVQIIANDLMGRTQTWAVFSVLVLPVCFAVVWAISKLRHRKPVAIGLTAIVIAGLLFTPAVSASATTYPNGCVWRYNAWQISNGLNDIGTQHGRAYVCQTLSGTLGSGSTADSAFDESSFGSIEGYQFQTDGWVLTTNGPTLKVWVQDGWARECLVIKSLLCGVTQTFRTTVRMIPGSADGSIYPNLTFHMYCTNDWCSGGGLINQIVEHPLTFRSDWQGFVTNV